MRSRRRPLISEPLVGFLAKHALYGFATAIGFVAVLMAFNIANLHTLIVQSGGGFVAICLLTFMIGLTFASVQMGFATMVWPDQIGAGSDQDRSGFLVDTERWQDEGQNGKDATLRGRLLAEDVTRP